MSHPPITTTAARMLSSLPTTLVQSVFIFWFIRESSPTSKNKQPKMPFRVLSQFFILETVIH
jgi:hypothetical protein